MWLSIVLGTVPIFLVWYKFLPIKEKENEYKFNFITFFGCLEKLWTLDPHNIK